MPILDGPWGPELRMRDPSLGVRVCPDEPPGSQVWTPVTCAGLSIALEFPALTRQLRETCRSHRRNPQGPETSEGSTWVEEEQEEVEEVKEIKQVIENNSAHLEADGRLNSGHAGVLLAERRGSYPPIDLQILK
ncbi:hypothetical protein ATANTOWER_000896, partial [Ataeniobius toweri]|nr:hypothetical protein [Ataeniobius toweri]